MNEIRQSSRGRGFSLIELIVFIVVVSAAAVALMVSLGRILPRGATAAQMMQANFLAQERMALIVGQKPVLGFSSTNLDPCNRIPAGFPPAICTALAGFTVSAVGATSLVSWSAVDPTALLYRQVTVTVTNQYGTTLANQVTVLANE